MSGEDRALSPRTLVRAAAANAMELARRLSNHAAVR